MARKWREFFNFLQSFVLRLWGWLAGRGRRRVAWVLGLGALVLVLASAPGAAQVESETTGQNEECLSQVLVQDQVLCFYKKGEYSQAVQQLEQAVDNEQDPRNRAILQVNLGRLYSEIGRQVQACRNLKEAFGIQADICEGDELGEGTSWITSELAKKDETQAKSLRIFGDVLRGVGELDTSQKVLETAFEITSSLYTTEVYKPVEELRPALLLSLGNTYRALGNLERDRKSPPQYIYLPWQFSERENFGISSTFAKADAYYICAENAYAAIDSQQNIDLCSFQESENKASQNLLKSNLDMRFKVDLTEKMSEKVNMLAVLLDRVALSFKGQLGKNSNDYLKTRDDKIKENIKNLVESFSTNLTQEVLTAGGIGDQEDLKESEKQLLVYVKIGLARNLNLLSQIEKLKPEFSLDISEFLSESYIEKLLDDAISSSTVLSGDLARRTQSYAIGSLGGFYEYLAHQKKDFGKIAEAKKATQEALYKILPEESPEVAYQLYWQMARLLLEEQKNSGLNLVDEVIENYKSSVDSLRSVRGNLLKNTPGIQFSFRDGIEPLYRDFIDILLSFPEAQSFYQLRFADQNITPNGLLRELKGAELENLFDCKLARNNPNYVEVEAFAEQSDATAAIIYPIVLEDRIEVLLKLPQSNEVIRGTPTIVSSMEVNTLLSELQKDFPEPSETVPVQKKSQMVYDWIIKPIEHHLVGKTETLVFVLDSPFTTIPISALYNRAENSEDGKYLVEDYAVAISTGLPLYKPRKLEKIKILLAGIEDNSLGFPKIRNIQAQFASIKSEILDYQEISDFTKSELEDTLNSDNFPIVYLASHGKFSSNPKETFIITKDQRLNVDEIGEVLEGTTRGGLDQVEILVLIACQAADGDKWANLGIAGFAVRTGAGSIVAPLGKIATDDYPGELMASFFKALQENPAINKAQALQIAQKEFIASNDSIRNRPSVWAQYILLENWL